MNRLFPNYYSDFQCIGSACQDNCCIGWEICIDSNTLDFYRQVPGTLGEKLQHNISNDNPPHFTLTKELRCPFLTERNLCELHTQLGEKHLCTICAEHPRFHNWFGNEQESGLGLCCEEAARLILFSEQPVSFVQQTTEQPADSDTTVDTELLTALREVRQVAFSILECTTLPLLHRLALLVSLAQDLQNWFAQAEDGNNEDLSPTEFCIQACWALVDFYGDSSCYQALIEQLQDAVTGSNSSVLEELLQFHGQLIANDPAWPIRLDSICPTIESLQQLTAITGQENTLQRICSYFVYRYFLSYAVQGDALGGLLPGIIATLVIALLNWNTLQTTGTLTQAQQILNAKAYSKEVEYSPENLKTLNDAIWSADFLSPMALIELLL